MESFNSILYLAVVPVSLAFLLFKLRHLVFRWRNPRLVAVCAVILDHCMAFPVGVPANQRWLASVTGVQNFGVLVLITLMSFQGALFLAVALLWRHPARHAWRLLRWVFSVTFMIIVAMVVLFAISATPEARPTDWHVYYADQPAAVAVALLWLIPQFTGAAVLTVWCLSWARNEEYEGLPWLRRGLRLYGFYGLTVVVFAIGMALPMAANWFGVSALDSYTSLVPAVTGPVMMPALFAALVAPVWGPRLELGWAWIRRWGVFLRLRSLHAVLMSTMPEATMVATGKRFNPHHRVRRMLIELNDAQLMLTPLFDPAVGEWAERAGRQAGLEGEELAATVETAQLAVASQVWRRDAGTVTDHAVDRRDESVRDGGEVQTELIWWLRIARAFKRSPVVGAALTRAPWHNSNPVNS